MPTKNNKARLRNELAELAGAKAGGRLSAEGEERLDELLAARPKDDEPPPPPETSNPGEKPPRPASTPDGAPVEDGGDGKEECCCEKIVVLLEEIKIVQLTSPQTLKDDVVVTAHSFGKVMAVSPQPFAWPLVYGKIKAETKDKGGVMHPNVPVAVVESGRECRFELDCQISFWEEDAEKLEELLNETTQELIAKLSASATGVGVPTPGLGLIAEIIRLMTEKLGLSNDRMGTLGFGITGKMACDTPLKDMQWMPPLAHSRAFQHDVLSDDVIRLKKRLDHDGGLWDVSVLVQRICPKD